MTRILITGGLGFIGSHLEPALKAKGYGVTITDRIRLNRPDYIRGDICDHFRMQQIFDEVRPDVVIHLAAMVSRKESEETPYMAIQTNVNGTLNVVKCCMRHQARIIYAGSSEEYGTAFDGGTIVTEGTPFGHPTSVYSMTKRMADELIQYYATSMGLSATTLRFFMLYGPGEPATDYRSAMVRFFDAALKGLPLNVHKDTVRQWCYIDDAIDAVVKVVQMKQKFPYQAFNIGNDEQVSTIELARLIISMTGSKSAVREIPVESTVIPVKLASFHRTKIDLGWEATTPLVGGMREVYRSMMQE